MSNKLVGGPVKLTDAEWYAIAYAYFSALFGAEVTTQMLAHMPGSPK